MYKAKRTESLSSWPHVLCLLYIDQIQWDNSSTKQYFSLYFQEHYDKQLIDSSHIFNLDCTMRVLLCRTLRKNKPKQTATTKKSRVQTLILTVFFQRLGTSLS